MGKHLLPSWQPPLTFPIKSLAPTWGRIRFLIPQADLHGNQTVDFWAFLGIQLFLTLELRRTRGIPLLEWLAFCTQSATGAAPKKIHRRWKNSSKPWYRDNAWQ